MSTEQATAASTPSVTFRAVRATLICVAAAATPFILQALGLAS